VRRYFRGFDLHQNPRGAARAIIAMDPRKPPQIKNCPICRLAMVGERTDNNLSEFNSFRCLGCDLTITTTPAARSDED
jgi:hypothetical protein